MPDIIELHTSELFVENWVKYGLLDAEVTFLLYQTLKLMMMKLPVNQFGMKTTWDLYQKYWLPFGELLTDIERKGFFIDIAKLKVG